MLILKALKPLINTATMPLAIYVAFGLLLSQFFNIHSYYVRGGTKLMTWYKILGLTTREPSIILVSQVCLIMAIVVFLSIQLFATYALSWSSLKILQRGVFFFAVLCFFSQALFSSVMRLSYESLFCFVAIAAMTMDHTFLQPTVAGLTSASPQYEELWDLLKFITPICLGIPILMGAAGFITSFYQTEQEMIRLQLYRHIAMVVYFELGAVLFLIYPVLKRILLIKGT